MTDFAGDSPVFALVDDHIHSARLMSRALGIAPVPARIVWLGHAVRARRVLGDIFARRPDRIPDMVIVDLKAHSGAGAEFIAGVGNLVRRAGIPIVAMAANHDAGMRGALVTAGADEVFIRHHDIVAYRREVAHLADFWVRETVTWPIRA